MKFRRGFVSNSSTTSFCVMGAYVENVQVTEQMEEDLEVYADYDADGYVGLSPEKMEDTETPIDFKNRVQELFNKHSINENPRWLYGEIDD